MKNNFFQWIGMIFGVLGMVSGVFIEPRYILFFCGLLVTFISLYFYKDKKDDIRPNRHKDFDTILKVEGE